VTGLDTNILVRYLVEDDADQAQRVHRLLSAARVSGEPVYVSCIVLCELAWTLGQVYGWQKQDILAQLDTLLDAEIFRFEEDGLVRRAVALARESKAGFADCLIGQLNLARGCRVTVTFDRALRSDPAFQVL
jgi:predicted nucleic-acid-binding protein